MKNICEKHMKSILYKNDTAKKEVGFNWQIQHKSS